MDTSRICLCGEVVGRKRDGDRAGSRDFGLSGEGHGGDGAGGFDRLLIRRSKGDGGRLHGANKRRSRSASTNIILRRIHGQTSVADSDSRTGGQLASCKRDLGGSNSHGLVGSGAHNGERVRGQDASKRGGGA